MSRRWLGSHKNAHGNEMAEHQKQLETRLHVQEDRTKMLEKQNSELKKELGIMAAEKNELLSRLSRIAGDQMSRGNPDIADLSDPNRPTKLAEKWNSLYTEEWLDAYEELKKQKNQTQIVEKQLLDILVLCYHQCQAIADDQVTRLRFTLEEIENYMKDTDTNLNMSQSRRASSARLDRSIGRRFMDDIINTYKQRRCRDSEWIQAVTKKCANHYISNGGVHSKRVLSYVTKCAELCWFMRVHNPPMVIEYEFYTGQDIDRNKFNLYSGKGTKVDYIVWPALFLNRGNGYSVLAKGTIQPVSENHRPLPKRKSSEKLNDGVTPVPIHNKTDKSRIPSTSSMGVSMKHKSAMKSSFKATGKQAKDQYVTSLSGVIVDVGADKHDQPATRSRISNPEKLLLPGKHKGEKLHSTKPLQYTGKHQTDFSKSVKKRHKIDQP
ncbi:uncharacterized protein LOC134695696 [Mytilus trossulus]|uniref:uncharacterized protein LOC134695696 n=1 Tax=Mytilus trossulus TaxID=6551 RepID=UPI003003F47C